MSTRNNYTNLCTIQEHPNAYIIRCPYEQCNSRIIRFPSSIITSSNQSNFTKLKLGDKVTINDHELVYDMIEVNSEMKVVARHRKPDKISEEIDNNNNEEEEKIQEKPGYQEYFVISSMWDFDNIGVSKTKKEFNPDSIDFNMTFHNLPSNSQQEIRFDRYLICSDCNRGPLGFAGFLIDPVNKEDKDDVKDVAEYVSDINKVDNLRYFLNCNSVVYN